MVGPAEGRPELLVEVHVVTFPDQAAFAAYRADPRLRESLTAVVQTATFTGEDGPDDAGG